MSLNIAFAGFRHFHILAVYDFIEQLDDVEIVAVCEPDAAARTAVPDNIPLTHENYAHMLDEIDCDIVAVGDYYAARGSIIIDALKRGKHVISDKPICTSLAELDEIENLASQNNLTVGCQLDLLNHPNFICLKQLIETGQLGEVHQIAIGGQHPLNYGTRPGWYFEPGKQGGTINDIAVHAISVIPWMVGCEFQQLIAARCWNAYATEEPHFKDSAQFMATLTGGTGVMADVSYAMPHNHGYTLEQYWRTTIFGSKGIAETAATLDHVKLSSVEHDQVTTITPPAVEPGGYFRDFLSEIAGESNPDGLTTEHVLKTARITLEIQQAADKNQRDVKLMRQS